jgi:quaternary ammonium compound-resistance protein SugE
MHRNRIHHRHPVYRRLHEALANGTRPVAGRAQHLLRRQVDGDDPARTAYATWGGLGAAGTLLIGILYFGEPVTLLRMAFLTLLILSIVGLKPVTE